MIEIKDLHFSYSKRAGEVLRGTSLALADGEIGILLGKNGAGKSTLFKIILALERPAAGSITLNSVPALGMSARERARRVSYVPQDVHFGGLSVFDTVLTGRISDFGTCAGEKDREKVSSVLEEMDLTPYAHRSADRLSGGEKQKVAIARAIVADPELIVFDEPTGALDLSNEFLIAREMRRLAHERGISVLCSMHDLSEAAALGDKFFFMKDGAIRCSGGKELFTEKIIKDVFDVSVRVHDVDGQIIITGGYPK